MVQWLDQRMLLRVMVAALAAAGALAVAAVVLTLPSDVMWRMFGTALATALASSVMLGIEHRLDTAKTRAAAQVSSATAIAVFILIVAGIWQTGSFLGAQSGQLPGTALAVFIGGMLGAIAMRIGAEPRSRYARWTGVGFAVLVSLLVLAGIWEPSQVENRWWMSAWTTFLAGATCVACLVRGDDWRIRPWRCIGVIAGILAWGLALSKIWRDPYGQPVWVFTVGALAAVAAHANILALVPLKAQHRWLRLVTIGLGAGTAVVVVGAMWTGYELSESVMGRIGGALGIPTASGTLIVLVLGRLAKRRPEPVKPASIHEIAVTCPQCQTALQVPVHRDAGCGNCGLWLHLQVYEPRCPQCDYLLYYAKSGYCPECGAPVTNRAGSRAEPVV